MKKGISLIVLVITIIVMIIIAGAIIISLNSSNVIGQANDAVEASNIANARSMFALTYSEILGDYYTKNPTVPYDASATENEAYYTKLKTAVESLNTKEGQEFSVEKSGTTYVLTLNGTPVEATAQ